jgi:hypothetical protein
LNEIGEDAVLEACDICKAYDDAGPPEDHGGDYFVMVSAKDPQDE